MSSLKYAIRTDPPNPEHGFPRSDKSHLDQPCYRASKILGFPGPIPDVSEVALGTFILASTGKHQAHQSLQPTVHTFPSTAVYPVQQIAAEVFANWLK